MATAIEGVAWVLGVVAVYLVLAFAATRVLFPLKHEDDE